MDFYFVLIWRLLAKCLACLCLVCYLGFVLVLFCDVGWVCVIVVYIGACVYCLMLGFDWLVCVVRVVGICWFLCSWGVDGWCWFRFLLLFVVV